MGVGDHVSRVSKIRIRVTTVDPSQRIVEGVSAAGDALRAHVTDIPPNFRWPKQDEDWSLYEENGYWRLGSQFLNVEDQDYIAGLGAGDSVVYGDNVMDQHGGRGVFVQGTPTNGQVPSWQDGIWVPGTGGGSGGGIHWAKPWDPLKGYAVNDLVNYAQAAYVCTVNVPTPVGTGGSGPLPPLTYGYSSETPRASVAWLALDTPVSGVLAGQALMLEGNDYGGAAYPGSPGIQYCMHVINGGSFTFTMTSAAGADTLLFIENPTTGAVIKYDDDNGPGRLSEIDNWPLPPGNYIIRVCGYDQTETGDFTLNVSSSDGGTVGIDDGSSPPTPNTTPDVDTAHWDWIVGGPLALPILPTRSIERSFIVGGPLTSALNVPSMHISLFDGSLGGGSTYSGVGGAPMQVKEAKSVVAVMLFFEGTSSSLSWRLDRIPQTGTTTTLVGYSGLSSNFNYRIAVDPVPLLDGDRLKLFITGSTGQARDLSFTPVIQTQSQFL